ncbi:hypothetical protein JL2886_02857 [Phaeobacter gallaeciensis]|uniref:Uncharacterized protein n=1 Tax=Phaeobacter gallaeciensis TaxID=60890 RepID=A0A1B0ZU60_9RHOB|nr:hypothetical protein JL2886_02857 [Phaeobacter gallaeciensis]
MRRKRAIAPIYIGHVGSFPVSCSRFSGFLRAVTQTSGKNRVIFVLHRRKAGFCDHAGQISDHKSWFPKNRAESRLRRFGSAWPTIYPYFDVRSVVPPHRPGQQPGRKRGRAF